jgi:hypothetical protein
MMQNMHLDGSDCVFEVDYMLCTRTGGINLDSV